MIMFRHILPNSLTPIITFLPFSISGAIMALVGLDFLGFGLKYPAPSLGDLLSQGQQHMEAWWIMIPAFVTLTTLMILLTFIGDGVRNAFDPRYKQDCPSGISGVFLVANPNRTLLIAMRALSKYADSGDLECGGPGASPAMCHSAP
jgi:hypothetical protein